MKIEVVQNKANWNAGASDFTQSFEWGEILIAEGGGVERLAVTDSGEILAQAQIVYHNLPFGWKYAFCPRGPQIMYHVSCIMYQKVMEVLGDYLKSRRCIFFRVEPEKMLQVTGYRLQVTHDVNPRATSILDLSKSEEELLSAMHPKTRYNIRLGEKGGLRAKWKKDLELFLRLTKDTAGRDGFRPHAEEHYRAVLNSDLTEQVSIFSGDTCAATAVFVRFKDTYTYLYGASHYELRHLMAPHFLQWEGIKRAKNLGCKFYDFFGISPLCHSEGSTRLCPSVAQSGGGGIPTDDNRSGDPSFGARDDSYKYDAKHQYAGVTRFKLGFGGEPREMPGTFDLIIDKNKYKMYKVLRWLRRMF